MKNLIVFTAVFGVITSYIVSPSSACTCVRSDDIPESYVRNPILHIKVTEVENSERERDIYDGQETIRYNTQEIKGYEMIKLVSEGGYELENSQYYGKTVHFNKELLFDPNIEIIKQTIHPEDSDKAVCGACSHRYGYLKTDIQKDREYIIFLYYSESENIYKIQGILEVIDNRLFNQFYDLEPNSWVSFLYNKIYYSIENDLYFDIEDFGEDLSGVTEVQRHLQFLEDEREKSEIFEDDNNENQDVEDEANKEEEDANNTNNQLDIFKWLGAGVLMVISIFGIKYLRKR